MTANRGRIARNSNAAAYMANVGNLRESYASCALAGLGWDANHEKAIDRVAASGKASALGVALWKTKYLIEAAEYRKAQALLLTRYLARYTGDSALLAEAIVDQALHEYIAPQCRACNGEGESMLGERRIVCESCAGSKVHRFTDTERAGRMQISYGMTRMSAHKLKWLIGFMEGEDATVNFQLNVELERAR